MNPKEKLVNEIATLIDKFNEDTGVAICTVHADWINIGEVNSRCKKFAMCEIALEMQNER